MNRKLIITEEQYRNLKFRLLESTFDKMANHLIKKGDIVTIKSKGKDFNFKVLDNYGGRIYMDNTDDGTRIFITTASFQNNSLEVYIAQNEEQKNQNPPKGETWGKMTFQNVDEINVSRDGKLIDGTELDPEELAKNENKRQEKVKDFIDTLLEINEGEKLTLDTAKIILELIYNKQEGNKLFFTLSEDSKTQIDKDDKIELISINLDEKDIKIDNEGKVNIKLTEIYKDKSEKQSDVKVDEWTIDSVDGDDENPEGEKEPEEGEPEDGKPEDEKEPEDYDSEKYINMLRNSKELQTMAYDNPSAIKSFIASLKGEEPETTGTILVKNILDSYTNKKTKELNDSFLRNRAISFELLRNVEVPYGEDEETEIFNLIGGKPYRDNWSVRRVGDDEKIEDEDENYLPYFLRLENKKYGFEIIVKEETKEDNVYTCDIRKVYIVKTAENPKGEIERSEPIEDVKVRFLDSQGYKTKNIEK